MRNENRKTWWATYRHPFTNGERVLLVAMLVGLAILAFLSEGDAIQTVVGSLWNGINWTAAAAIGSCTAAAAAAVMVIVSFHMFREETRRHREEFSWEQITRFRSELEALRLSPFCILKDRVEEIWSMKPLEEIWSLMKEEKFHPRGIDAAIEVLRTCCKEVLMDSPESTVGLRLKGLRDSLDRFALHSPDVYRLLRPIPTVVGVHAADLDDPVKLGSLIWREMEKMAREYSAEDLGADMKLRQNVAEASFRRAKLKGWSHVHFEVDEYVEIVLDVAKLGKKTKGIKGNWGSRIEHQDPSSYLSECIKANRVVLGNRYSEALSLADRIEERLRSILNDKQFEV